MGYKHGLCGTRIYQIRKYMLRRCNNPNYKDYSDYGGRGIYVCDEWADKDLGAERFYHWAITHGYEDDLSIDMIDPDKGYSPDNCRWASKTVQARNTRPQHNSTGYPGVHRERSGRYYSCITENNHMRRLGTYDTPEEAFSAYQKAKTLRDILPARGD